MTEPEHDDTQQPDAEAVAPMRDPVDVLTIAELDAGSRQLGTSLISQVTQKGDRYERALVAVLWLHKRRTDRSTEPGELWRQLSQLTFVEVSERLGAIGRELAADSGSADPLASRPA